MHWPIAVRTIDSVWEENDCKRPLIIDISAVGSSAIWAALQKKELNELTFLHGQEKSKHVEDTQYIIDMFGVNYKSTVNPSPL